MLHFLKNLGKDCEQFDLETDGKTHNAKGTSSVARVEWAVSVVTENHDLLASTLEDLSDSMLAVSEKKPTQVPTNIRQPQRKTWKSTFVDFLTNFFQKNKQTALPTPLHRTKRTSNHGRFPKQSHPSLHRRDHHLPPAFFLRVLFRHEPPRYYRHFEKRNVLLGAVWHVGACVYYLDDFVCVSA